MTSNMRARSSDKSNEGILGGINNGKRSLTLQAGKSYRFVIATEEICS
ncbi:MAG: hypothetical protein JW841_11900 [Deltaproteobacteria bacterium]|nr:hypothetical protein [Deltaproteobacteria bacterium]